MSELHEIQLEINAAWRNVQNEWANVRGEWRDALADRFEKEFWDDLETELPRLLGKMNDMDSALEQARQTVEEN